MADELVGHEDRLTPWAMSDNGDIVWWFASERGVDEGRVYVCATRPLEWAVVDDTCSGVLRRSDTTLLDGMIQRARRG